MNIFSYTFYSKYPVKTVGINKIERGPANSNGFEVRQLHEDAEEKEAGTWPNLDIRTRAFKGLVSGVANENVLTATNLSFDLTMK